MILKVKKIDMYDHGHFSKRLFKWICCLLFAILLFTKCATVVLKDDTILSLVNNQPITYAEFKQQIQSLHLKEGMERKTDTIDIRQFIDRMIERELIVQEGIRLGFDTREEVNEAVKKESDRLSLLLLHREEIEDKVNVGEEEAWTLYKADIEKRLTSIKSILEGLKGVSDLDNLDEEVRRYLRRLRDNSSILIDPNFSDGRPKPPNEIMVRINDKGMTYQVLKNLISEKGGTANYDKSSILRENFLNLEIDRELLKQLLEDGAPSREKFENVKGRIIKQLKKDKIHEREHGYLAQLKANARIKIDEELLLSDTVDQNSPVAFVNTKPIIKRDVLTGLTLKDKIQDEKEITIRNRLQYLIDCEVIDQEIQRRNYNNSPYIKEKVERVKHNLIYNLFIKEVLVPLIEIDNEMMKKYYEDNIQMFMTPLFVKAEEIRVETQEEAENIINALEKGADFSFLSKRSLDDRMRGFDWINVDSLNKELAESLKKTHEGDIAGPVKWEKGYSIFFVKRIQQREVIPFEKAKKSIHDTLFQREFKHQLEQWAERLKASTNIVVYDNRLNVLEKMIN